jgi:hypothetical protein
VRTGHGEVLGQSRRYRPDARNRDCGDDDEGPHDGATIVTKAPKTDRGTPRGCDTAQNRPGNVQVFERHLEEHVGTEPGSLMFPKGAKPLRTATLTGRPNDLFRAAGYLRVTRLIGLGEDVALSCP